MEDSASGVLACRLLAPWTREAFQFGQDIIENVSCQNALELFLGGLSLEVLHDHRIIITGADLGAIIDGESVAPTWKTFHVWKGQTISFTKPISGAIAYIIPEGGFYAQEVLGSRSSYPKGLIGEVVKNETILYANTVKKNRLNRGLRQKDVPKYREDITVELFKAPISICLIKPVWTNFWILPTYIEEGIGWDVFLAAPTPIY